MSLLPSNITEKIQEQIYIITVKLGSVPWDVINYGEGVQVNWIVNGKSYMWRSENHGVYLNYLEVDDGKSDPYNVNVSDL